MSRRSFHRPVGADPSKRKGRNFCKLFFGRILQKKNMSPYFSTKRIIGFASCFWLVLNLYFMKLYVDTVNHCVKTHAETRNIKASPERFLSKGNNSAWLSARSRESSPRRHPELKTYSQSYSYGEHSSTRENSLEDKKFDMGFLIFSINYGGFHRGFEVGHTCEHHDVFVCFADGDISEVTSDYDVIIFAGDILNDRVWDFLTEHREPNQVWLFAPNVSPMKSMYIMPPPGMSSARFNVSFTHHSMSELSYSYGEFYRFQENRTMNNVTDPFLEYTRKLIAWDSADCADVSWDRSAFVADLSNHLPVEIYGDCGNLSCRSLYDRHKSPGSGGCKHVLKEYKFVLALEDGCCSELVSDHFWSVLHHYKSVPVVVGPSKADYLRVAPPNSFIFAGDFSTIGQLAGYIREVAKTPKMYDAFFEWKKSGGVQVMGKGEREISHKKSICRVADYLRSNFSRKNGRLRRSHTRVEPYGPFWRGGCNQCRNYEILKKYET